LKILLLNQCFYPDVVSTAQHLTDLATELASRGYEVTVVTSDRGYDEPAVRFKRRERWNGIDIIRIPSLSFGKARADADSQLAAGRSLVHVATAVSWAYTSAAHRDRFAFGRPGGSYP
jgi:hypothetical protein